MHHHRMSFYWDTNLGEYLFPGLNVNGLQALVLLSLVMIFLTVIYEAIKVYQTQTRARTAREHQRTSMSRPVSESANLINTDQQQLHQQTQQPQPQHHQQQQHDQISKKFIKISGQAFLFLFHNTLGYVLMLSVMVYNGYLFIIVVLGLGLGYFLFGHISMRINMENIRARTTNVMCVPKCPPADGGATSSQSNCSSAGYVNEMVRSSSSSSSLISEHGNKSNITETSNLEREVEIHPGYHHNQNQQHEQNKADIIQSCRL